MNSNAPPNSIHPETRGEWRDWLAGHYSRAGGIWVISWKKNSGKPHMTYGELVEEALCFGWIDSKPNALDEMRSMRWFAPRKPGTGWSKLNKERAERAIATGRMSLGGLTIIEKAKQDGSWFALDAVEALSLPPDLTATFATYNSAAQNFEKFPRTVKRNILEWISTARTEETRRKRISETAMRAEVNERANQWRK